MAISIIPSGPDGKLRGAVFNSAVPQTVLQFVSQTMEQDPQFNPVDLVHNLRKKLLPGQYNPTTWNHNEEESLLHGLRTLIATYMFRERLEESKASGRDLTKYAYIPPVDSDTGTYFHDRGDHNHILKRLATHTRKGNNGLQIEGFIEILKDKEAGTLKVTYACIQFVVNITKIC